ncbi:MAG: PfkB family carbohydrate kinase [Candidatus Eiseniibacteriota bacterium]
MSAQPGSGAARLIEIVDRFRGRKIAVLGDLVTDEFVYADIDRISREAPVLILGHDRTVVVPGGGGNAAANLRALGAAPLPVGVVGRDDSGKRLLAELRHLGISVAGVLRLAEFETPTKSRILAGGVHTRRQQIVRLDRGAHRGDLPAAVRRQLAARLRHTLERAGGLLVADYSYGAAAPEIVADIVPRLVREGTVVTVDSRTRMAAFRGVSACTPNQEEVEQALGSDTLHDDEIESAGRRLLRRTGNRAVLVTRGAKGMSLFERGRPMVEIPPYGSDEVADVTGAGDTVIATFTLALLAGASSEDAAVLANYAAGIVVTKAGTATVASEELIEAIREDRAS